MKIITNEILNYEVYIYQNAKIELNTKLDKKRPNININTQLSLQVYPLMFTIKFNTNTI